MSRLIAFHLTAKMWILWILPICISITSAHICYVNEICVLRCDFKPQYLSPNVYWYKYTSSKSALIVSRVDSTVLSTDGRITVSNLTIFGEATMYIQSPQTLDSGSYHCNVKINNNLRYNTTIDLVVVKAPYVVHGYLDRPVTLNARSSSGMYRMPRIEWSILGGPFVAIWNVDRTNTTTYGYRVRLDSKSGNYLTSYYT